MSAKRQERTRAFHAVNSDGTRHVVGIENLRVIIVKREDHWFAQGLDIDYAAEGRDIDDVRRAFEYGLAATIAEHIKEFRTIDNLLCPAPEGAWKPIAAGAVLNRYSQVSAHVFPFSIEFLQAA